MKSKYFLKKFSIILLIILIFQSITPVMAEANQKIYDYAELLTAEEQGSLEYLSDQYSEDRQTDIVVLTFDDSEGMDVEEYMQNFYDDMGLGYDKSHGNTVILTVDMDNREVYVAGFYKGEEYIDNSRADLIRERITPELSRGSYFDAFQLFIELSNEYLGVTPDESITEIPNDYTGVGPGVEVKQDNILQELWFQIVVSMIIAGVIVTTMVYRSGGRVTTSARTYLDEKNSEVTKRRDTYVRTDITKVKKPSNKNNSGGGGGITSGGHSHSGSRGRF